MSKRSQFNCLEVGDKVVIKDVKDPTLWEITATGPATATHGCRAIHHKPRTGKD